eukprot:6189791-Pleurochrysis_carterae.AAC.1
MQHVNIPPALYKAKKGHLSYEARHRYTGGELMSSMQSRKRRVVSQQCKRNKMHTNGGGANEPCDAKNLKGGNAHERMNATESSVTSTKAKSQKVISEKGMRGLDSPCSKGLKVPRTHLRHRGAVKFIVLNSGAKVRQNQKLRKSRLA